MGCHEETPHYKDSTSSCIRNTQAKIPYPNHSSERTPLFYMTYLFRFSQKYPFMKRNNSEYPVREHGEKKITIYKVASATTSSGNKYFHLLHRQASVFTPPFPTAH
jgi:hypothetical protein